MPQNYKKWCLGNKSFASTPCIRLTDNHPKALLNQLSDYTTQWYSIGIQLGFSPGELDNIQASPNLHDDAPISWLTKMLTKWFLWVPGDDRGSEKEANLEELKAALRSRPVGLGVLAPDLHI